MALQYSTAVRNARLDQVASDAGNAALLRIYDGTPPANADAALGANVLLGTLVCGTPFAPGAAGGVLTANAITQDSAADATGTATFYRVLTAGLTVVAQGTVGTVGADLNLNTTSIVAGGPIVVSSLVWTEGNP